MGTTKINTFPVMVSICLVLSIEYSARKLHFLPLMVTGLIRMTDISLMLLIFGSHGGGITFLGLSPDRILHGIKKGAVWSTIFGIIAGCFAIVLFFMNINPIALFRVFIPENHVFAFFIVGGIIGPVAEEIFFRGMIYGYCREVLFARLGRRGVFLSVVINTILFASAHPMGSAVPLPQIIGGVVFCISYEFEKTLLVPMTIHSVGNLSLFTLSLMH